MIQAGWLGAIVKELSDTVNLHKKPNGTRQYPAPSCCNLRENYPELKSGTSLSVEWGGVVLLSMPIGPYWIDPNGGCEKDAIEVWCGFSKALCQSCIDPKRKVT